MDKIGSVFLLITWSLATIAQSSMEERVDKLLLIQQYNKADYCSQITALSLSEDAEENLQFKLACLRTFCLPDSILESRLEELEEISRQLNNERATAFMNIAIANRAYRSADYNRAIQNYVFALDGLDPDKDRYIIALSNLAIAYGHYANITYDLAIAYYNKTLDMGKELDELIIQIDAIDGLASTYSNLENSKMADSLWNIHTTLAQASGNLNMIYYDHNNRGFSHQLQEQFDSAAIYFEKAIEIARELKDSLLIVESYLYLGENASWAGKYDDAIEAFNILEALPDKYYNPPGAIRVYTAWATAEAGKGNFKNAFEKYKRYKEIYDEYWNEETKNKTLEFETRYQTAKKDAEISAQKLQINQNKTQRNFLIIGALGLGLLTWFLFYRNKKNQNLAMQRIENLEKQQKLLALDYMVQGQEEERKRIAQDLHDGLGALLASAHIQLQKIQREIERFADMNLFSQAEKIIDEAHREVRRISHDMMPGALMDLGLVDAIDDLVNDIQGNSALNLTFQHGDNLEDISDKLKVNLYRIIQEVTHNTVKHASAQNILISIVKKEKNLILEISDDGKGFDIDEAKNSTGLGLKGILSRVKYLEGELTNTSSPEEGTKYRISIPW